MNWVLEIEQVYSVLKLIVIFTFLLTVINNEFDFRLYYWSLKHKLIWSKLFPLVSGKQTITNKQPSAVIPQYPQNTEDAPTALTNGPKVPTMINAKNQQNAETKLEERPLKWLGHSSAIKSHGSGAAICKVKAKKGSMKWNKTVTYKMCVCLSVTHR